MNFSFIAPRGILPWLASAVMAVSGCAALPAQAQEAEPSDIFHFSGAGKVCPQIVSLVEGNGGRVDWGENNLIAYDSADDSKHFQTWVMNPDGSGAHCLSNQNQQLAHLDNGNPAWHPSGNYLVVEASDMAAGPPRTSLRT